MIYLQFRHSRHIFSGTKFKPWIVDNLPSARFEGCEYGNNFPTIAVMTTEFISARDQIETKHLIGISGSFNVIEYLSLGIRAFSNSL